MKKHKPDLKQITVDAVARLGGPAAVGRLFEPAISSQAVSQWEAIPLDRAVLIEIATKGQEKAQALRPDKFGQ